MMFNYALYAERQRKEAERRRIRAIISQLRAVSTATNSLNNHCIRAKGVLQSNVSIDDKAFKEDEMNNIIDTVSDARDSINNIISSLYSLMSQI